MATRTDPNAPLKEGTTQFLVPAGTLRFAIGRTHNKIGWRFYRNAELIFDNYHNPDANSLLEANEGGGYRRERDSGFNNIEISGNLLGIAQAAFEHALDHAQNHFQAGKIIIEHRTVALKLDDMYMCLEVARSYYFKVVKDCLEEGTGGDLASK